MRPVRIAAAGAVAASVLTLAACDQPAPKITIQSGSTSSTVSPTSYSFDSSHTRTYKRSLPEITSDVDSRVLIDVPRKLAKAGWTVTAYSLSTQRALATTQVHDQHTFRVPGNTDSGNPFVVQVQQLRDGKADGSKWSFLIKVDTGS